MTKLTKEELQKIADLELPKGKAVIIIAKLLDHIDALEEEIKNHRNNIKNLETEYKTPAVDTSFTTLVSRVNDLHLALRADVIRRENIMLAERELFRSRPRVHPRIEQRISENLDHYNKLLTILDKSL